MNSCLFCKIINKEIPADIVYEDEFCLAFKDINPKAPIHILVIPKIHISSLLKLNHLDQDHKNIMGELTCAIPKIAHKVGLSEGFKTIINTGQKGGQEVFHIHYHLMGS